MAVVLVIGVFAAITRGAFVTDVFLAHPDPYSKRRFLGELLRMIRESWPLVILAAVAVGDDVARRRLSAPVAWLVIATATTFTAGALGSNDNHFLEWNTVLCLAGGLGIARVVQLRARAVGLAAAAVAAAAVAVVLWRPREIRRPGTGRLQPGLRLGPHPGGAESALGEHRGARARRQTALALESVRVRADGGARGWSDAELVRLVREQRFDAVIVRSAHLMSETGAFRRTC